MKDKLHLEVKLSSFNLCIYFLQSLDFSLVLLDGLLPHHNFLMVLLQLVLLIVDLDTEAGLLGLKLKTEATCCV